jgi:hypothetical protein
MTPHSTTDPTQGEVSAYRSQRSRETRAITIGAALVCAPVVVAALVPAVDQVISGVVSVCLAAAVAAILLRWAIRRCRWWLEDRLDARIAAEWRAEHGWITSVTATSGSAEVLVLPLRGSDR